MTGILHPRDNAHLFGQEAAEAEFASSFASGRMPHAWIISGQKGSGKATLAYRVARAVLAGTAGEGLGLPDFHPVFRRVQAGSHADLLSIEALYDEKKDERKQEISIDQAREIAAFLSLTPAESQWRVVIIDSADELNINAANAILKIVEEPPPRALLLLVSHHPGRLLPTIRSRCRLLKLPPISNPAFRRVMDTLAPDVDYDAMDTLAKLSDRSPGLALNLIALNGLELYADLCKLIATLPNPSPKEALALAESIARDKPHARFQLAASLILRLVASAATEQAGEGEEDAVSALLALKPPTFWAMRHAQLTQQFSLAARLHLDYKTVLIDLVHSLTAPEPTWNRALST